MLIYNVLLFCSRWEMLCEKAPFVARGDESKVGKGDGERIKPPIDALGKTCCLTILNVCKSSFLLKRQMIRLVMFYWNEIMKVYFRVGAVLCKKK